MSRILKPIFVLWLCLAVVNAFAAKAEATSAPSKSLDPYLQLAKFYYHKGELDKALLTIEQAAFLWPVVDTSDRYIFSADILVEQKRFEQAQKAFSKVLGNKKALTLMAKVSFPLAQLHFAKGNCAKSLRLLRVSNKTDTHKMLQSFYIRSHCLSDSQNAQLADLEALQRDVDDYLDKHKRDKQVTSQSMWFSYTYYNLAIAAQNLDLYDDATALFDQAKKYSVGAPESRDFVERIVMTQAFSKYSDHQYDKALALFSTLDLDGLWLEQSLLGFGWSAYHNYQQGLALEAWRQLINLPTRSMSTYEVMITIPFALEKSKSFARALKSYDFAVDNYIEALQEIDVLQSDLDLTKIRAHALEYIESLASGRTIEPLHPLLTSLYTQDDFRFAVTRVGKIAFQKEKLKAHGKELDTLSISLGWQPASSDSPELKTRSAEMTQRLEVYKKGIYTLRAHMLDSAMKSSGVDESIRVRYERYLSVKEMADKYGVKSERMQRLQGVILWQLYESGEYPSKNLVTISRMLSNQRMLQARLDSLPISLDEMAKFERPGSKQIAMLKARIDLLDSKLDAVSVDAEQHVLNMTLAALEGYEERIKSFQKQARIARARLREEFYQLGGAKNAL